MEPVIQNLQHKGFQILTDQRYEPKRKILEEVESAIALCDIFLVIITKASLDSPFLEQEFVIAKKQGKRIIPCISNKVSLSNLEWGKELQEIQSLQFSDSRSLSKQLDTILDRLVRDYKPPVSEGPKPSPPSPPPPEPLLRTFISTDKYALDDLVFIDMLTQ